MEFKKAEVLGMYLVFITYFFNNEMLLTLDMAWLEKSTEQASLYKRFCSSSEDYSALLISFP